MWPPESCAQIDRVASTVPSYSDAVARNHQMLSNTHLTETIAWENNGKKGLWIMNYEIVNEIVIHTTDVVSGSGL